MAPAVGDIDSFPLLGSFDYLVVGAGPSAAGLLKALLTEQDADTTTPTVALLEQGGGSAPNRAMNQWTSASQTPDTPKIMASIHGQRVAPVVKASGLGGNTRVNAGLLVPPAPEDFDTLPYVNNSKEVMNAVNEIVKALPTQCSPPPTAAKPFDASIPETPFPRWNAMTYPSVCTRVPCCVDAQGDRVTYYEALVPQKSPNLELFIHHKVERIEAAQRLLIVRHTVTDRLYRIQAKRDIILCAGTIETPALLVASGLMDAPTPIIDHSVLPSIYLHWPKWNSSSSGNGVSALSNHLLKSGAKIQVGLHEGGNLIDMVPYLVAMITWFHVYPGEILHQILLKIVQFLVGYTPLYFLFRYCTTALTVFLMNPKSHGTMQIVPKDKDGGLYRSDYDISIDLNYMSDPSDFDSYEEAWKLQYFSIDGVEIFPLGFSKVFAKLFVMQYFHWMGTCRNIDKDWYLSSQNGQSAVRVCDASILPGLSAPTALTCASLGYVLGKKLTKECKP